MKHYILPSLFLLTLICVTVNEAVTYSASAPPTGMTNAPGESDCTSCHAGTLNTSGGMYDSIFLFSTVPFSAFQPNTTYTMSLIFINGASTKFGFEMVALPGNASSSDGSIGTFTPVDQETEVNTSGNREYVSHSSSGTSASSHFKTWGFEWKTPSNYNGNVDFYVVVNCTNGDNTNSGDAVTAKVFSATVLPVKWLSSGTKREQNNVLVSWSTASEINNHSFEIERSKDAKNWEMTGSVKGKGNSSVKSEYAFTDVNAPSDFKYYRIKQVDYDGKYSYSTVMALDNESKNKLYNVVYDQTQKRIYMHNITINTLEPVSVYNSKGETIMKNVVTNNYLDASSLPHGIYFITFADGSVSKKLFIY